MDFDEVLPHVGEFGTYQKLMIWLVLLPGMIPCGFNAYSQLFMASIPDHWCKIPELQHLLPDNHDLFKNISIPLEEIDGQQRYSRCQMRDLNYTELLDIGVGKYAWSDNIDSIPIVPCKNGWNYDLAQDETTIVADWDLVCDKQMYPTIALSLFGVGGLVGDFLFGYVQDGLGRKPAFFMYLLIICTFGIATAFANSFIMWTIFRVGVGFTIPAIMGTPMVLALEIVGAKHRTLVNLLSNIMYSISLVSLSGVVYLVRDWRSLALYTSVPFVFYFLFWFMMPESPRWLLSQGRNKETRVILTTMARINGKSLTQDLLTGLDQSIDNEKLRETEEYSYGSLDVFRTPNLRIKSIILMFIWFTSTSVYVGLSYYAPSLGGDEYLNFFLAGAVELPTYLFLWPSMQRWGRRWILCASMAIGGSACLATFLVKNDTVVTLGLYCVGKMGISSSFVVILLMTSEIYPTVIRGLGMGVCSVFGGLGPIIIPLINYLGTDMLTLPLIIMGALLILGGAISLLLPETLHKHLPQTLEDGERIGINYLKCCNAKTKRASFCENSNETEYKLT